MRFDPIYASEAIKDSYHEYVKSTFFIRDDEFREQFDSKLNEYGFSKGPFIDATSTFKQGNSLKDLVDMRLLNKGFARLFSKDQEVYTRPLYLHQEQAINEALKDRNVIITTGTGSGKTECFLYPILDHLFKKNEVGSLETGINALLLYPMNALANDQMKRLRKLLKDYPDITFGVYTGETKHSYREALSHHQKIHREDPIPNELISRDQMKERPPHILITNYAMLEYLLIRPSDNVFFQGVYADQWKYVVLDEAHTYRGATGMEVSILLRRLMHKFPNQKQIRYILTSATLGDESSNDKIISFASRLCGDIEFLEESIIRAQREKIPEPAGGSKVSSSSFRRLVEIIDEEDLSPLQKIDSAETSLKGCQHNSIAKTYQEWLYDLLCNDPFTCEFRRILQEETPTIHAFCERIRISPDELKDFIVLANYALKGSSKLLDIRYHHFIRTLEGAYVTFKPKKTLTVRPRNEVEIKGQKFRCFKISVCQFCGEIYLIGFINKEHKFDQSIRTVGSYFMLINDEFLKTRTDDDGDEEKYLKDMYSLCCKCGSIYHSKATHPAGKCTCGAEYTIQLFNVRLKDGQMNLHRCEYCKATNPRTSVIRGFYIGQNAAAAVIGSSLYEQMPIKQHKIVRKKVSMGKSVTQKSIKETKQLLIFSDSRQDAAYFAPYFQFTYQNIVRRRIIMQSAEVLCDTYKDRPIPLMSLIKKVAENLEIHRQSLPEDALKEAWKVLLYEMRGRDRNGLVNLGLLSFTVDSDFADEDGLFGADELRTIDTILMEGFLQESAITFPQSINFTKEDFQYFMYRGNKAGFLPGVKNKDIVLVGYSIIYWLAKTSNRRMNYLSRTKQFKGKQEIESFLSTYWEAKEEYGFFNCNNSIYTLNPEKIFIRVTGHHEQEWYVCDICGRLTQKNYNDICPHFRCNGTLTQIDPEELKQYHREHLTSSVIFPMKVREHTAQLSHERAAEYQESFIDGDINVLSSSTTFELGVDVGDLETIFMRNMPPNPSNYIQRAGRAGRRSDSAAYALTFCRLSNHDLTFFNEPEKMINGLISPPVFKIDNEKIVRRHVYAALFADFWKQYPMMRTVSEFMDEERYKSYIDHLQNIPEATSDYIRRFVPDSLPTETLERFITKLYEEEGLLERVRSEYLSELSHIESLREELVAEGRLGGVHDMLDRAQKTIKDVQIIAFLSRKNLIPKYGFPVDTVELRTDLVSLGSYKSRSNLHLQRDLFQAITDYAPGAEVIADGMMYTSRYVKRPYIKDHDWRQFDYAVCSNPECGKITSKPHLGDEEFSALIHTKCPICGSEYKYSRSQTFIVPEYGFIVSTDQPEPVTTKEPRRMARTQIHYVGDKKQIVEESIRKYSNQGIRMVITTSKDDELAIINRSSFYVCKACGYAEEVKTDAVKPFKKQKHKTPYGRECSNSSLVNLTLGHKFKTDVTRIMVNSYMEDDRAYSLLYALLEGMSTYFDIERGDIDGCLQREKAESGEWSTVFILFDKVPGGAGNANRLGRLSERQFLQFISCCYEIVDGCTCGDNNDGNAACYSCLCNYGNQYYHEILKRKYAIDFFAQILGIQKDRKELPLEEPSIDIKELTDHMYDEILDGLSTQPLPEAYFELSDSSTGECIGQADLAWPGQRIAIVEDLEKEVWEDEGWRTFSVNSPSDEIIAKIKELI